MKRMHPVLQVIGSIVALILIFSGGVDFGATTVPGLALLAVIWGLKL